MALISIGVNHRSAPVELREALAFDAEQAGAFLEQATREFSERLLLSTCNRTELFAVPAPSIANPVGSLVKSLEEARGVSLAGEAGHAAVYRGDEAVRHLFRVACGLDSMVLGETQITGQVKNAGEIADRCGTAGPIVHRALHAALHVAKRARTETAIGEGAVSVASVAVDLAQRVFGELGERSALVIGAGETGRLVSRHLRGAGIGRIRVANRTLGRAQELARDVDGEPWGLCGVPGGLREADVVITATGAAEPILSFAEMKAAMRARKGRMLLVLDIAIPRDVDPRAAKLDGVFLHDIEVLRTIVDRNLEVRRRAVPKVERMVDDAVEAFAAWERGLSVVPAIQALKARFEEIRKEELAKNLRRIPEEARPAAERLTESLVKRLLHPPITRLRGSADDSGGAKGLVAALRELFGIKDGDDDV